MAACQPWAGVSVTSTAAFTVTAVTMSLGVQVTAKGVEAQDG